MQKEYDINQYPKFKDGSLSGMSDEQRQIRDKRKHRDFYATDKVCKSCAKKLPMTEYFFADKANGRRKNKCKDCVLKEQGVLEIGKNRFSAHIKSKGFKRCSGCKEILPFHNYHKSNVITDGHSNVCKECSLSYTKDFLIRQKESVGNYTGSVVVVGRGWEKAESRLARVGSLW